MNHQYEEGNTDEIRCPYCGADAESGDFCDHLIVVLGDEDYLDRWGGKAPIQATPEPEEYLDEVLEPFDELIAQLMRFDPKKVREMILESDWDRLTGRLLLDVCKYLSEPSGDYENPRDRVYGEAGDVFTAYAADVIKRVLGEDAAEETHTDHICVTYSSTYFFSEEPENLKERIAAVIADDMNPIMG